MTEEKKKSKARPAEKSEDQETAGCRPEDKHAQRGRDWQRMRAADVPAIRPGDELKVFYRVIEAGKERIQTYEGTVIAIKNSGHLQDHHRAQEFVRHRRGEDFPAEFQAGPEDRGQETHQGQKGQVVLPEKTERQSIPPERTQVMADFSIEAGLLKNHHRLICGLDEVGRGCLFGPVVAGAVILDPRRLNREYDDSKKLSPARRLRLARDIYQKARAYSIGWCWNDEIDRCNILEATKRAMRQAFQRLQLRPDHVLVDAIVPDFLPVAARPSSRATKNPSPSPPPRSSPRCSATGFWKNFPAFSRNTTWRRTRGILPKNIKI